MSTQRIRADLTSSNKFVVALALSSLSEVATEDMCRDLAPEVAQVISNTSSLYVKKKAVLAAVKCIVQSKSTAHFFLQKLDYFLEDKNPSVMQGSIHLSILLLQNTIQEEKKDLLSKISKNFHWYLRILRGLLT